MAVIKSLRNALTLLREQPILFVPLGIFALLQIPQMFLETLDPMLALAISLLFMGVFIFVTPVFYAGTIGVANDAAGGTRTSLGRFWKHAKTHYVSVLVAYLILTAISFGFGLVISIGVFFGIIAIGVGGGELLWTIAVAGTILIFVLAYFIALFALHFYAHAIVIEGVGAIDGLSRSVGVVRQNIKPVVGYGLLSLVLGGIMGGGYALITWLAFPSSPAPGEPAPAPELVPALFGSAGLIVFTALFATFFAAFSVSFYRELIGASEDSTEGDRGTDTPDVPSAADTEVTG